MASPYLLEAIAIVRVEHELPAGMPDEAVADLMVTRHLALRLAWRAAVKVAVRDLLPRALRRLIR